MTQNKIAPDVFEVMLAHEPQRTYKASLWARLSEWMSGQKLDRAIEDGVLATAGTALAVHVTRLTSLREREQLARALRTVLCDARGRRHGMTSRIPVRTSAVLAAADLVDELTLRLHAPLPVRARGMARLRLLLSDGRGPLYRTDSGSLSAALRGVLAAL